MQWKKSIVTIDVHCAGETGRVVISGLPDLPGKTMAEKLHILNTGDQKLQKFLCSEPRSGPSGSMCLLLPPTIPEANAGLIVLQPDKAHAMSGSNAMCTVTALLESDILPMNEPETVVVLDTAAGPVTANATCANGRVEKISLDMPPSFVTKLDAAVETPEFGKINYDLCFGGIFYALIDVEQVGLTIVPDNARKLATLGVKLHEQISAADPAVHPLTPELNGLSYVMFRSEEPDGAIRTCTTLIPGRVDRSPCGTGSNSNIAAQYARKKVTPGDIVISRSIIGGEFSTKFLGTTMVGPYEATSNRLTGKSWIYSTTEIRQDDSDPFPNGFTLSDTWGSSTK